MSELSVSPQLTPNVHDSSPLGTLIRRTSSRRAPNHIPANLELPTPPRSTANTSPAPPHSPILHAQFRSSTATASSYYDDASMRTFSWDGRSGTGTVPSSPSSTRTFRGPAPSSQGEHLQAYGVHQSVRSSDYDIDDITARYRDTWRSSGVDPPSVYKLEEDVPALPTVVVSTAPEPEEQAFAVPGPSRGGRVPSRVASGNVNFSRPGLPPEQDEERKRDVLIRNAQHRPTSPYGSPSHSPAASPRLGQSPLATPPGQSSRPTSPASLSDTQPHSNPQTPYPPSQSATSSPSGLTPRIPSQMSVYSNYSYYELPSTPTSNSQPPTPGLPPSGMPPAPAVTLPSPGGRKRAKSTVGKAGKPEPVNTTDPKTPQDYLQLGIQHHLENRLAESAAAFEKAATLNGGCGVGMLMWGLAQRHGWGCPKSEVAGFRWLRRAAELAVSDLEKGKNEMDMGAVRSELVLAIYEVGQSFYRGWGVEKDKEMAVQYFRVAARLGDPDAQQELAFCLLNGKGCKKDKRESAKWYRAAVAQGVSDIGLAWIYKDKYQ
ncbi:hypothetical protein BN946_scf184920.g42 [Trametes cinnabarina]|uniref:HCP-like protein n=1 Tax=Pycnoporus cinnabarinus TaxID=5643 RepID=A0A060SH74_PYCCI|nr:hypothetical protein BN946_scf184920.g42 [Trametes cinnabarina]